MSRITEIFLVDTLKQDAVAIRSEVTAAEIPAFIGEGIRKLEEYIKSKGVEASDSPFLRIVGTDPQAVEITAGIAVPAVLCGSDEIENCIIPAGKKLLCYWQGDDAGMQSLYEEMQAFAKDLGYETQEGCYEYYLNGSEFGTDKLLTKVVMLLQ